MLGVDSLIRAAVRMTVSAQDQINILYFKQLSAGGDLGGLSDAIKTTLYDVIKTFNPTDWLIADITLTEQIPGGGTQLTTTYNTPGTNTANASAITTAGVASLRTALSGRSHRGRNYFPVCSPGVVQNGYFTPTDLATLQAAYDAFVAIYGVGGTDTDYTWGVWSRKLGDVYTGTPPVLTSYNVAAGFFPINAVKVDNVARVQRRREVGVGS